MNTIELSHVFKARGSGRRVVQALSDVSLAIHESEVVLLTGPSGSGKTTLLAVAAGLLAADSGSVTLAGVQLAGQSTSRRRTHRARAIGFVFQHAHLLGSLSVRENVMLAGAVAGMDRASTARSADQLLESLGLTALADSRPEELSGGEEQRAAIARALVHGPALVLADEPTASLDAATGRSAALALVELAISRGTAVLIATHDSRLQPFATRAIQIVDGRVSPE